MLLQNKAQRDAINLKECKGCKIYEDGGCDFAAMSGVDCPCKICLVKVTCASMCMERVNRYQLFIDKLQWQLRMKAKHGIPLRS